MFRVLKKISKELSLASPRNYLIMLFYLLLAILEGLTDGLGVGLLTSFITNLSQDTQASINIFQQTYWFLPDFLFLSSERISFLVISLFLLRIIVIMVAANFKCILPQMLLYRVRDKIVEKSFSLSLLELEQKRSGKIINLLTLDSGKASQFVFAIIELTYLTVLVTMYLLLMASINHSVFAFGILVAVPFVIAIRLLIIILTKLSKKLLEMRNEITANCTEKLNNIRFIKSIGNEYQEYRNISDSYLNYRNIEIKRYFTEYFGVVLPQFFVLIGLSIIIFFIFYQNGMYKPYITLYVLPMGFIGMRCFTYISQLNNKYMKFKQDFISASAIIDFWYEHKTSFSFSKNLKKQDYAPFPSTVEDINFKNISFNYDKHTVLNNFSLKLKKGIPVILKGKSGVGKTTTANLMRMLIEPDEGKILVNDIPLNSFNPLKLRSAIGYATQDAVMMYGNIFDNLLYGLDSKPTEEEILLILKETGCYDFISNLPDGLNTIVSEKGSNFSGGQKQRLALARILLRKPMIMILDEITNNLDKKSKSDIIKTVNKLTPDLICLVITHDDDFILDNQEIVFL